MNKIIYYLLPMTALLSSCGIYTNYTRPAEVQTDSLLGERVVEERTDSLLAWQQFFSDDALKSLIAQGLEANTDVRTARLRVNESQLALEVAKKAFLPTLAFAPQGALSSFDGMKTTKTYSIPVAANWQIDAFGSLRNSKKQSEAQLEQTKAYLQAVHAQVIATVANSYYSLLLLDSQLQVMTQTQTVWKQSIETMQALKEAGLSNEAAIAQAQANYLSVCVSVEDMKKSIKGVEDSLCALLGETPHRINRARWDAFQLGVADVIQHGVPLHLLAARPDVKQAEQSLASAFYAVNVARSAFYPNITLSGSAGWTNNAGAAIVNPAKILLSAAASLTQPIFQGGRITAQYKIAQAQQEEAKLAFQQALLNAGVEVNSALDQVQAARQKQGFYTEQQTQLQTALQATELLMQHGTTTYLEVLTAQQSLLAAQLNSLSNSYDEVQGFILLYQALGGGTH